MTEPVEAGLVSTIVPVHDRAALLREAVQSVLAQGYRPIEVIVVDDGSTDDTPRACAELADAHAEVKALRIPNGGPGLAREAGRQVARGEFIQYLDSDDLLRPRKFELQVAALRASPECGAVYGPTWERALEGREPGWASAHGSEGLKALFPSLLSFRPWQTPAPLYRRSVVEAVGPWTDLRQEEDVEYDARVAALRVALAYVPEVCADIRHPTSGRASGGSLADPQRMRSRQRAHVLVYRHARRAGLGPDEPHMQHYALGVGAVVHVSHVLEQAPEMLLALAQLGLDLALVRHVGAANQHRGQAVHLRRHAGEQRHAQLTLAGADADFGGLVGNAALGCAGHPLDAPAGALLVHGVHELGGRVAHHLLRGVGFEQHLARLVDMLDHAIAHHHHGDWQHVPQRVVGDVHGATVVRTCP